MLDYDIIDDQRMQIPLAYKMLNETFSGYTTDLETYEVNFYYNIIWKGGNYGVAQIMDILDFNKKENTQQIAWLTLDMAAPHAWVYLQRMYPEFEEFGKIKLLHFKWETKNKEMHSFLLKEKDQQLFEPTIYR